MPRKQGDTQTFYNYEIELDDNIILQKYKDRYLRINRIQKPIFKTVIVEMEY